MNDVDKSGDVVFIDVPLEPTAKARSVECLYNEYFGFYRKFEKALDTLYKVMVKLILAMEYML